MKGPIDEAPVLKPLQELPAELTLDQVGLMVLVFPLAGVGAGWLAWCKLHINSIAMSTTGSIILAGGLYLASPSEPAVPRTEAATLEAAAAELPMPVSEAEEAAALVLNPPEDKVTPAKEPEPIKGPPAPMKADPLAPPLESESQDDGVVLLASLNTETVQGLPAVVLTIDRNSRSYDLKGFTGVQLATSIDVTVTEGEFSVTAMGDQQALDRLRITVEKGLLRIDKDHEKWPKQNCEASVSVSVRMPVIDRFEVLGSGNLAVGEFKRAEDLTLGLAGSGDMIIGAVNEARSLRLNIAGSGDIVLGETNVSGATTIRIAGSGDVRVAGRSGSLDIGVSGSGNVSAGGLESGTCKVRISGSGDVIVNCSGQMDSSISGSGQVVQSGSSGGARPRGVGTMSY
ncbi:MAG: DUF2807 domain-containing protein [Flavobacteriales bacterium]|nr:DUF2807 domain-containing protein [Flavobacteriales bacterium]